METMHPKLRISILAACLGLSLLLSVLWVDGYYHFGQMDAHLGWLSIGCNWSCGRMTSTVRFRIQSPDPLDIGLSRIPHEETYVKRCRDKMAQPGSFMGIEAHHWPDRPVMDVYQLVVPIPFYLALLSPYPLVQLIRHFRRRMWAGDRISLLKPAG